MLSVLVPLDGSELAEAAIQPASQLLAGLATFGQGTLHLLRVVAIPSTSGKYRSQSHIDFDVEVRAQAKQEAEAYLQALVMHSPVTELAARNVTVTTEVVVTEDVAHAILLAAEPDRKVEGTEVSREQSIIAMATHGRGGLGRWAFGSKTERVLGACKVPLLIIRPHRVNAKHTQNSGRAAQDGAVEGEELIMVEEMWVES
jgi:nucleotide-binding universal stress UspA family protein